METNKVTKIRYRKSEEITERDIIATSIPNSNIRAIDVSELEPQQRDEIAEAYEEYSTYLNSHMKTAFSFENWLSHSKGVDFAPKWRTFKAEQTDILLS